MTRHSFIWSLLAMVLVFMGLRASKRRSLSARGREWPVVTEKEILRALGVVRGQCPPPMPWPVHADDYVFLASETYDHPELTESWAELATVQMPTI